MEKKKVILGVTAAAGAACVSLATYKAIKKSLEKKQRESINEKRLNNNLQKLEEEEEYFVEEEEAPRKYIHLPKK